MKRTLTVGCVIAGLCATFLVRIEANGPQTCVPDTKLIGRMELSTDDRLDTWWGLTKHGLAQVGIDTEDELLATLNTWLGSSYTELEPAAQALVDAAGDFDRNGNGYVCAIELRGRRAWLRDPTYALYTFGVDDDRHAED